MREVLGFSFKFLGFSYRNMVLDVGKTTLNLIESLWESYGQVVFKNTDVVHKMCTKNTTVYPCKGGFLGLFYSPFLPRLLHKKAWFFPTFSSAWPSSLYGYFHSFHRNNNNNELNI